MVESKIRFAPGMVVSAQALGQGSHNVEISAPAVILPPMGGMGAQIIAAPGAHDPALAALMPPLPVPRPHYDPPAGLDPADGQGILDLQYGPNHVAQPAVQVPAQDHDARMARTAQAPPRKLQLLAPHSSMGP